jgi:hypothetical protein
LPLARWLRADLTFSPLTQPWRVTISSCAVTGGEPSKKIKEIPPNELRGAMEGLIVKPLAPNASSALSLDPGDFQSGRA